MIELINTKRQGALTRLDKCAQHLLTTQTSCKQTCGDRVFELEATLVKVTVQRPDAAKVDLQLRTNSAGCKQSAVQRGNRPTDAEATEERHLPPHVTAVYVLRNCDLDTIDKTFEFICPDCGHKSPSFSSATALQQYISQHVADTNNSSKCKQLRELCESGVYSNATYGSGSKKTGNLVVEPFARQLFARAFMLMALHIVTVTDPGARKSTSRTAAAEAAALQQWRKWAVSVLTEDVELLEAANWVRPSLRSLKLPHRPSLLDLMLALPYVAVAESGAGKRQVLEKLAALLYSAVEQQGMGLSGSLAAAAAVAFVLPELLATDPVFGTIPADQRLQEFLLLTGINSTDEIANVMTEPFITGHLEVCAVCGLEAKTLAKTKRGAAAAALHKCSYCLVSVCNGCKADMDGSPEAGSQPWPDGFCPWCSDHPDTKAFLVASAAAGAAAGGSSAADAAKVSRKRRSQQGVSSSMDTAAAGQKVVSAGASPAAAAAAPDVPGSKVGPWHKAPVSADLLQTDAAAVSMTPSQFEVLLNRRSRNNRAWRVVYDQSKVDLPEGYVMVEVQLSPGKLLAIYYAPDGRLCRSRIEMYEHYEKQQGAGAGVKAEDHTAAAAAEKDDDPDAVDNQGFSDVRDDSDIQDLAAEVVIEEAAAVVEAVENSDEVIEMNADVPLAASNEQQRQHGRLGDEHQEDNVENKQPVSSGPVPAPAASRPKRTSAALADAKIHEQQHARLWQRRKSAPAGTTSAATSAGADVTVAAAAAAGAGSSRPSSTAGVVSDSEAAAAAAAVDSSNQLLIKRRGRPPGSKNRPKLLPLADDNNANDDVDDGDKAADDGQQQPYTVESPVGGQQQPADGDTAAAAAGGTAAAAGEGPTAAAGGGDLVSTRPGGRPARQAAVRAVEKVHGWTHAGYDHFDYDYSSDADDVINDQKQAESDSIMAEEHDQQGQQQQQVDSQPVTAVVSHPQPGQGPPAAAAAAAAANAPSAAAAAASNPGGVKGPQALQAMLAAAAARSAPRAPMLPINPAAAAAANAARFGGIPIASAPLVGFNSCGPIFMVPIPHANAAAMAAAAAAAGRMPPGTAVTTAVPRPIGMTFMQASAAMAAAAAVNAAAAARQGKGSAPVMIGGAQAAAPLLPRMMLPPAMTAAAGAAGAAGVRAAVSGAAAAVVPAAAASSAVPVSAVNKPGTATALQSQTVQGQQQQQRSALDQTNNLLRGQQTAVVAAAAANRASGSPAASNNIRTDTASQMVTTKAAPAAADTSKPSNPASRITVNPQVVREAAAAAKAVAAAKKAASRITATSATAAVASPDTVGSAPAAVAASTLPALPPTAAAAATDNAAPAAAASGTVSQSQPAVTPAAAAKTSESAAVVAAASADQMTSALSPASAVKVEQVVLSPAAADAADVLTSLADVQPKRLDYQQQQRSGSSGSRSHRPSSEAAAAADGPSSGAAAGAGCAEGSWDESVKLDLIEIVSRLGVGADVDIVHNAMKMLGRKLTRDKVQVELESLQQQMNSMAALMGHASAAVMTPSELQQLFSVMKQHQRTLVQQARKQQHRKQQQQQQQQFKGGVKRKAEQQRNSGQQKKRQVHESVQQQSQDHGRVSQAAVDAHKDTAQGYHRQQQQQHDIDAAVVESDKPSAAAAAADDDAAADKVVNSIHACVMLLKQLPDLPQEVLSFLQSVDTRASKLHDTFKDSKATQLITQLQVLLKVLSALVHLESNTQKSEMVRCLKQLVPEGYGPSGAECSTFDLLCNCWEQEVQLSGCSVEAAAAAAAAGPLAAAYANDYTLGSPGLSLNCFIAGMCEMVLDFLQTCCKANSSSSSNTPVSQTEAAAAASQTVDVADLAVEVLSGTAVLLLHWPSAEGCFAERCVQAGVWRQRLIQHSSGERLSEMKQGLQDQLHEFLKFMEQQAAMQT